MSDITSVLILLLLTMAGWSIVVGVLPKYTNIGQSVATTHLIMEGLIPIAFATLAVIVWYLGRK